MKRILLVANKNWEVEPILNALLNKVMRSKNLPDPDTLNYPWKYFAGSTSPRAVWNIPTWNIPSTTVELWCIQDIMDAKWNGSSSQGKNEDLHRIFDFRAEQPDLVIALGTAAFGDGTVNNNGCVVVGSNIFLHNYHPSSTNPNPQSVWDDARFEKLIQSSIPDNFFDLFSAGVKAASGCGFLRPYLNSTDKIQILAKKDYLAVSTINVTNYAEYTKADQSTIDAARANGVTLDIGSVETTHGIIRLQSESPFVFISGITDREGHFDEDVNGRDAFGNVKTTAQNYTAAFNIGVCLANVLPDVVSYI